MRVDTRFLQDVGLFSGLSDQELVSVSEVFEQRAYKKNAIIFFEQDSGKYIYIVKEGRVKVSRLLPTGKETILAFHERGEYFGEMALIDGLTEPAMVTAVVATTILFMSEQKFSQLLDNPKIGRVLLKRLCTRCRDAWAQIEVLTFNEADARIRTALYHLCQKKGVPTDQGTRITIQLTHQELADMTGISRETATRVLGNLQKEKIVTIKTRSFLISDPEELTSPLLV